MREKVRTSPEYDRFQDAYISKKQLYFKESGNLKSIPGLDQKFDQHS